MNLRKLLRELVGAENELRAAEAEVRAVGARLHLRGPVHGTLQTIRGMCSDGLTFEEIDGKLAELDDLIYEAVDMLAKP